ncbi:hypothetical protein Trydic_g8785 [Trypoxylus dichotomus]
MVLSKKKNIHTRICIDYTKINEQIVKDRYSLPLIEDQLDKLRGARTFSTLELKTPFGLCNSPAIFQRFNNNIFREHIQKGEMLTYMDDLVIISNNEEEGLKRLEDVLETAQDLGLDIQWKKCQLMEDEIELGHHIKYNEVRPSETKVMVVKPRTTKQV